MLPDESQFVNDELGKVAFFRGSAGLWESGFRLPMDFAGCSLTGETIAGRCLGFGGWFKELTAFFPPVRGNSLTL
ncbi:MAG: hypothetical protein DWQ29_17780 [Planctomycetota bacterium]|nr:MAG: hypothetical protein DWQ29_17780 [Planctomycetota bacterium]